MKTTESDYLAYLQAERILEKALERIVHDDEPLSVFNVVHSALLYVSEQAHAAFTGKG